MISSKELLRKEMKIILMDMDINDYRSQCQDIHSELFDQTEWKRANTVATTISRGREIDTLPIIKKAWEQEKTLVVPKCIPETKRLQFRELTSFDQLEESYFGLKEPIISATASIESTDIDLIIVPGLIFDYKGYRIGFGGGYYDRFLADFKRSTVSLALNEQVMEKLPHEAFDIPVNKIITPKQVIQTDVR